MTRIKNKPSRLLPALDSLASLLLKEANLRVPEEPVDSTSFIRLYREAIEVLSARTAERDGTGTITAKEVALMCQCVLCSDTLQEAIVCAADFTTMIYPRGGQISLRVEDEKAVLLLDTLRKLPTRATCLVDLTGLLGFLQFFGWLIGEDLRVNAVVLGYPSREDAAPFLSLFGAPVYVGSSIYRLEFDAGQLPRPVLRRAEELREFLCTFPYNVAGREADALPLRFQVRACIDAALANAEPAPTPEALATLLGVSSATLRRHLQAEGVSFGALRDLSLREAAERYLVHTNWAVERIARQLGFSDSTTFRRAFHRWTGFSPSAYRRKMIALTP